MLSSVTVIRAPAGPETGMGPGDAPGRPRTGAAAGGAPAAGAPAPGAAVP